MATPERGVTLRPATGSCQDRAGSAVTVCPGMARFLLLLSVLFALAASPALAASGNGLYKPFPAGSVPGAAQAYYAQLGLALTARQLRNGSYTRVLPATSALGPSHRAGETPVSLGYLEFGVVAALALLAAGGVAWRRSRPAPRAGLC